MERVRGGRLSSADHDRLALFARAEVRFAVRSWPGGRIGDHDEDDLVSIVVTELVADRGAKFATFDAGKGGLGQWVSQRTRWKVTDLVRREQRRLELVPRTEVLAEELVEDETFRPDAIFESRALLLQVLECVRRRMAAPKARAMISALFERGLSEDDVAAEQDLERRAVQRWKSRIKKTVEQCRDEAARPEKSVRRNGDSTRRKDTPR